MGADNLAVADHWYRFFDDLTQAYPLIVFGRHGYEQVLSEYAHHDWCTVEYTSCLTSRRQRSSRSYGVKPKIVSRFRIQFGDRS